MDGEEIRYEMDRTAADGEVHTTDLRDYPLMGTDGTIIGSVDRMRDFTELEERIQER